MATRTIASSDVESASSWIWSRKIASAGHEEDAAADAEQAADHPAGEPERRRGEDLEQRCVHQPITSFTAITISSAANISEIVRSGSRCWTAVPMTTPAERRDADDQRLERVDVAVRALERHREDRDHDDRREARPGRDALAEAEPEDQQRAR